MISANSKLTMWLAFVTFSFIFGPLILIWGLNTLFPALVIPYTWETWLAVVSINIVIKSNIMYKAKKD